MQTFDGLDEFERAVGTHLGQRNRAASAPVADDTPSTSAAAGSKPDTSCPAAARLRAIGAPMFPSPMKPIRAKTNPCSA